MNNKELMNQIYNYLKLLSEEGTVAVIGTGWIVIQAKRLVLELEKEGYNE